MRDFTAAKRSVGSLALTVLALICHSHALGAVATHPPMRPLPTSIERPPVAGPKYFVEPVLGDDKSLGTYRNPWKTLAHALRQLKPGDTLYLRAGTYYEKPFLSRSGTPEAPITILSLTGNGAAVSVKSGWPSFTLVSQATLPVSLLVAMTRAG